MRENPKASLALCGLATPADAYAEVKPAGVVQTTTQPPIKDNAWLLNLANQRAESLITILRDKMHIAQSQLQRCRPRAVNEKQAKVELLL